MKIEVSLKSGHNDPEGETTTKLLRELGYKIEHIQVSKLYSLIVEASTRKEAKAKAEEMCTRLLANPTKDDYIIRIEEKQ